MAAENRDCPPLLFYQCANGDCLPREAVTECDGHAQCNDASDEKRCYSTAAFGGNTGFMAAADAVATDPNISIVISTIVTCFCLVVLMLFGIKKCKQWELNQRLEMRRTRRIIERLTSRLRENNLKMIMKAQSIRNQGCKALQIGPPPQYATEHNALLAGESPPPSYEDILLENFYQQHVRRGSSRKGSKASTRSGYSTYKMF